MGPADGRRDREAWLRLLATGIEYHVLSPLFRDVSHPAELFAENADTLRDRFGLTTAQARQLLRDPNRNLIRKQLEALDRHNISVVPITDPLYPLNLFRMRVPPPVLFVRGKLEESDRLAFGVVGPRNPTHYGVEVARSFSRDLAAVLTIVSGAALGIDSIAHQAALDAGGRTLAVLACGLDIDYPAANRKLREQIATGGNGALLSIFPPGAAPLRHHFPARNAVLAGLTHGVVIIEASEKSGALVTARVAAEEGRAVYAVPGDITRKNSAGSNALLRDGAAVCTNAKEILADLEMLLKDELEALRPRATAPDDSNKSSHTSAQDTIPGADLLLEAIAHAPVSFDELMARFVPEPLSIGDLSSTLLTLELDGKIRQLPGRIYSPAL